MKNLKFSLTTLDADCPFALIKNNIINKTGLYPGMGSNGTGGYTGIISFGSNSVITSNQVDSTGYDGIYFGGNNTIVKKNVIKNFCLVKDDGAGIYVGDWKVWKNKEIIGNIILNGKGAAQGTDSPLSPMAEGIYVDDHSGYLRISSNTIVNCSDSGIKLHNAHDIVIQDNTAFNNLTQLFLDHDNASSTSLQNITIKKNILFARTKPQLCLYFLSVANDIGDFGSADSNYYATSDDNSLAFRIKTPSDRWPGVNHEFSDWKRLSNSDVHSHEPFISFADNVLFEYNSTNLPKVIALSRVYVDVRNIIYKDKITIKPYSSIVLMEKIR